MITSLIGSPNQFFCHQLNQAMYVIYFILRYNGAMRINLGPVISYLIAIILYISSSAFFPFQNIYFRFPLLSPYLYHFTPFHAILDWNIFFPI